MLLAMLMGVAQITSGLKPAVTLAAQQQAEFRVVRLGTVNGAVTRGDPTTAVRGDDGLDQIRVLVEFGGKRLWEGTLAITRSVTASYGENLRTAVDGPCLTAPIVNDLAYNLSVELRREWAQSGGRDDYRITVKYSRSYRDDQCRQGTRNITLEAPVQLRNGEPKKVIGDGGLTATVSRL